MGINSLDGEPEETEDEEFISLVLTIFLIVFLVVLIGTIGYRIFGEIAWIDAFHNGAMIFTSTSLVTPVNTYNGKIFSSFYNLLTGIFVLVIIGVVIRKALSEMGISNTGLSNSESSEKRSKSKKHCKCKNHH